MVQKMRAGEYIEQCSPRALAMWLVHNEIVVSVKYTSIIHTLFENPIQSVK